MDFRKVAFLEKFYAAIAEALRDGERIARATVVDVQGSAPRAPGAQILVWESGRTLGTLGGGISQIKIQALRLNKRAPR